MGSFCRLIGMGASVSSSHGGAASNLESRSGCLSFRESLHLSHAVTSVQGGTDLLVSVDEALQLDVEVTVLTLEGIAVVTKCADLSLDIVVSLEEVGVVEAQVILLTASDSQVVLDSSQAVLSVKDLSVEVTVASVLTLSLTSQVLLVGKLAIEVSLESVHFSIESGVVILGAHKLSVSRVEGLARPAKFELLRVGEFGELIGSLASLEEVVVHGLDAGIVVLALALLGSHMVSHAVDLILILGLLFTQTGKLEGEVVGVFAHRKRLITLHSDLAAKGNALLLSAANLITHSADLSLQLVVAAVLLVQEEAQVLDFLA